MAAKSVPATAIQEDIKLIEAKHKKVGTGKRKTRKQLKLNV